MAAAAPSLPLASASRAAICALCWRTSRVSGSVCRIHTSSYRSIRQIHSALQEIQTFTGGRLAGITGKLVVRPEEIYLLRPQGEEEEDHFGLGAEP